MEYGKTFLFDSPGHKNLNHPDDPQILQKIQKEYQQLKSIQTLLHELSIDLQNPPSRPTTQRRQNILYQDSPTANPAAFFQADRDDCYSMPVPGRDPDVFGDPVDPRSKRTTTATKKPVKGHPSQGRPAAGKKATDVSKLRNSSSNSNMRTTSSNKRSTPNGVANSTPGEDIKEEFVKVKEENAEEEKKFEAGNHMEVDLVDMLGRWHCL